MCLVKTYLPWLNIVIYQKHLIIKPSFTDQAQFSSINRKKVVHFLFNCVPLWLKSGRCSRPQVSSVTCSYWTVQAATPWARPTTPLPPGAAALCLKPSPLAPCTAQASFPPTAPRHRAGTAPDCRTPWRLNILAPWEGRGSQAVFSIWPQRPAVCTPQCPTTCWTPTARIWPPHRSTALQGCTPIRPGSTPRTRPKCAASFAYPRQRPESVWTVERQLPLFGVGMGRATTCATPADCTTRWMARTDLSSGPKKDWLWASGQEHCAPTVTRAPQHCGGGTLTANQSAMPAGSTINCIMSTGPSPWRKMAFKRATERSPARTRRVRRQPC